MLLDALIGIFDEDCWLPVVSVLENAVSMVTQVKENEWMVEPDDPDCREYGRLLIRAERKGINVDGQALIPWDVLLAYKIKHSIRKPNGT